MEEKKRTKVGLCFNLKHSHDSDEEEEYDAPETIAFLTQQLESFGFEVIQYEQNDEIFHRLMKERPRWVMNIAEGKGNTRSRESQIPALLEWLNIPYYGSDPVSLGITLDKALTNRFLIQNGLPTPEMFIIEQMEDLSRIQSRINGKPYIVKPRWEGSSKGIFNSSVVSTIPNCRHKVSLLLRNYHQPALIEEFIDGDEITVAVTGNENPQILGMMKISEKVKTDKPFVYSIEHKRNWQETICYDLAEKHLAESSIQKLSQTAISAFKALELRDVARIDFRMDQQQNPYIIDINPLPGLSPDYSDLMLMSQLKGKNFQEVVREIIQKSLKRCHINTHKNEILHCSC